MYMTLNLWTYFLEAHLIIRFITITLLAMSIISWVVIIQYALWLSRLRRAYRHFENRFWSGIQLTELYDTLPRTLETGNLAAVFHAGFTAFYQLRKAGCQALPVILEAVERAMQIAQSQARIQLEHRLSWLNTISGSSPYIGLLGSVVGILLNFNSFQLKVAQEPLLMITSTISHSLTMTLLSLLSTLPAFIFCYRYTHQIDQLLERYCIFQDEFTAVLVRQAYEEHYEQLHTEK